MSKIKELKDRFFAPNPSFTLKEQLGYCGGIFGNSMGQDIIGSFSDKFSRSFLKVKPEHITIYSNIALALGFINAGVSGYVLDTPAAPGKPTATKIITGIMPIPFALTSVLLFYVPSASPVFNFIWMTVILLVFGISDSFYDASMNTLSLRMTSNAKDRKNFYTVGTLASALGSMLPEWLTSYLVGTAKNDPVKQQHFYFYCALAFTVIGVVLMMAPFFTLNEKIRVNERPDKKKLSWDKETILAILHNRTFIVTETATFFEQIRQLSYRMFVYVYEDVLGDLKLKAGMDALSGTLSYIGLLLVPVITGRFSARTVLSGGFAYTGLFYALMGLAGLRFSSQKMHKRRVLIGILIGLAGMPNNAIAASKKVIHAEGFLTATQSLLGNLFNIIRTNMYNIVFAKLGYLPNFTDANGNEVKPVQSEKTLKGIFTMFVLCGVVGNLLASISYLFDRYTGNKKDEIYSELLEMREARKKALENEENGEAKNNDDSRSMNKKIFRS